MDSSRYALLDPVTKCPFCSTAYDGERLRTLQRSESREMVHATCLQCSRAMFYTIERLEQHIACVGIFTDCDVHDALRFMHRKQLSVDDVLGAHETLKSMSQ